MKREILIFIFTTLILLGCSAEEKKEAPAESKDIATEEAQKTQVKVDEAIDESIVGMWVSISADDYGDFTEDGIDKQQFLKIENDGHAYMEFDGIVADGKIEKLKFGWDFHSDYGLLHISKVRASDPLKNGSISISMKSPVDDIILGYFKNIEELE